MKTLTGLLLLPVIAALALTQQEMVKICEAYGMNRERALYFTAELIEQCTLLNMDYAPLFFIAIAETGLKNVFGDSGKAVGYFQLHRETVWFVSQKYGIWVPKDHRQLISRVDLQIKIAACHFHYLRSRYGEQEAIWRWNGSPRYLGYYSQIMAYVRRVFLKEKGGTPSG